MRGDLEIALTAAGNLHVSIGIALADEMPTEKASKKFQASWVHLKLRVNQDFSTSTQKKNLRYQDRNKFNWREFSNFSVVLPHIENPLGESYNTLIET